jgi:tripartite-type tricarboxylate transporter receptor subunit TctC
VSADTLSRIVAAALSDSLGVPVIVDAKPGAGGNIASEFVSRATPDGCTIIVLTGGHAVSIPEGYSPNTRRAVELQETII